MNKDFVVYGDTDSCFVSIQEIIQHHCGLDKWNSLLDDKKLEYCKKISSIIIDYVNKNSYERVQLQDYNSQEHDFNISFKQEIIAKAGIFVSKKKYSLWVVDEEGVQKDEVKTKGLEIIQSSCPVAVKERLKNIVSLILRGVEDSELKSQIEEDIKNIYDAIPEEIALNIGINAIGKYHEKGEPVKGAPYHVKGVLNYRKIIKELGLQGNVPELKSGMKVKTVYVKPNKWNYQTLSFVKWFKEFDDHIEIDYKTMIEKTFLHKISFLLEPINKQNILKELSCIS